MSRSGLTEVKELARLEQCTLERRGGCHELALVWSTSEAGAELPAEHAAARKKQSFSSFFDLGAGWVGSVTS